MVIALVVFLLSLSVSHAFFLPLNASILPPFSVLESRPLSSSNFFLKEVLQAIAAKERWDPDGEVRVSEVDAESARVGESQRYEFHVRAGRTVVVLKFSDEIESWRKIERDVGEFVSDFVAGRFKGGPRPVVRDLELEGPLELLVGDGDDELSLLLPALNSTHKGLRQVLVGDGITIRVEGAQEVSLFHPYSISILSNGSSARLSEDSTQFWSLGLTSCAPLLTVQVLGSASIVAYRTRNRESSVQTALQSHDTIELLSEKCYSYAHFKQVTSRSLPSLSSPLALLEKILKGLLGNNISPSTSTRLLRAKITSSTLVKFRLELERDITEDNRIWKKVADWRTKPTVERIWFEILARVEGEKGLKQLVVRKLMKPLVVVESMAWSDLMSNISFTRFPSVVVPPEALTLDVKW